MITPDDAKSQIAEEFRIIKRPLIMNAFQGTFPAGRNRNLIMVTSTFPGEGKSFCSINLAMSIAMEMDHRVLLVDADVAKPSLPGYLGLDADPGLLDVLLDSSLTLSDVIIKTNVEKLTVLPAGRGHRHATELLASEAMSRLLQELASRYSDRIVIFDSPPLLATTESRVLAGRVGQIVMVVEAQRTAQEALREALQQIESCELISLLLNKSKVYSGADSYGYVGGYGS
jgi:receptor protein-tyrosine kinase